MKSWTSFVSLVLVPQCAAHSSYLVSFDRASASSTQLASGSVGSAFFGAEQALAKGSAYWCSSGASLEHESVSWVGVNNVRKFATGLVVDWAYSPGYTKVLTSPDGIGFEEAIGWREASQDAVAYRESFMFARGQHVKAASILMRSPRSWKYFGINAVALIADIGTFLLISAMPSPLGEQCVVSSKEGVFLQPCLSAIGTGDGREVFQFQEGKIANIAANSCLTLRDEQEAGGNRFVMDPACEGEAAHSSFASSSSGQLAMPLLGNFCVTSGGGTSVKGYKTLAVADCDQAREAKDLSDKFLVVSVAAKNLRASAVAKDIAKVLNLSSKRLAHFVAALASAIQTSSSCSVVRSRSDESSSFRATGLSSQNVGRGTLQAIVDKELALDGDRLRSMLEEARKLLARIRV